MTVEEVVQHNLDAYNNRDIETYMTSFDEDIKLYTFSKETPVLVGMKAFREFYEKLFQNSPGLHSTVLNRIVFNNTVIDHERILGREGKTEAFEIVMLYQVKEGKIYRMTILRE